MHSTPYSAPRALELLRLGTRNPGAIFRDGQEEAIKHVVTGGGRMLVVQRTGWGKSFVYFIAAKLLREAGQGPTILISPLLALMRNQIAAANRMDLAAVTINSENRDDWGEAEACLRRNTVDILLISPERLGNEAFRSAVLGPISASISLLVIDEAHCISDWGHDFRPHYRLIERLIRSTPSSLRILATTATANNRVVDDLNDVLGPKLTISRGALARHSLLLQTLRLPGQAARMAWLADTLPCLPGTGIIYTLTVRDAELLASWLQSRGIIAEAYSGQTGERREELEQALLDNDVKVLVATTALGMGFDKPDLAFVIHYQCPGSVVAYYQQVGRAGRALDVAHGVLLGGEEDDEINDYFIRTAFPTRSEVAAVLDALQHASGGLTINELMAEVNVSRGRIDKTLQLLSLESPAPIVKIDRKWLLTATKLSESFWERAERLTMLRRQEQEQMRRYLALQIGHMAFLLKALDGEPDAVTAPASRLLPCTFTQETATAAVAFLRRVDFPLYTRRIWPGGGLPKSKVSGRIPQEHQAEAGRILCHWGDAGWGSLVRKGKQIDGRFDDALVDACASMIRKWNPRPSPTWITCVPSERHPTLVPEFCRRLARALNIPLVPALVSQRVHRAQKEMANSFQQAHNLDGVFTVHGQIPSGAVLLLDDIVDSAWTLTVAAYLLKLHGSGPVFPVALASTAQNDT